MEYRLLENWILLDGTENVYYQEVIKSTEKQDFYVIKDNTVTVDFKPFEINTIKIIK